MEATAFVSDGGVTVVFDEKFKCTKSIWGVVYRELYGKGRAVTHRGLDECYQEVAHRSGTPVTEVRALAAEAIKKAEKAEKAAEKAEKKKEVAAKPKRPK